MLSCLDRRSTAEFDTGEWARNLRMSEDPVLLT